MDLSGTPITALPQTPAGRPAPHMYPTLDVGGPTVRPLVLGDISILLGTIPAGRCVPLHAHTTHTETFIVQTGVMQGLLIDEAGQAQWTTYLPGDTAHVPVAVRHAWRNEGSQATAALIITAAPLANFFLDIGRPVDGPEDGQWPPNPEIGQRAAQFADRWDMWSASPEENAAIGLRMS